MAATKSSYLQLFDNESKDDAYSFLVTNVQSKVAFEDAYTAGAGRAFEFKAKAGYKYYKANKKTLKIGRGALEPQWDPLGLKSSSERKKNHP